MISYKKDICQNKKESSVYHFVSKEIMTCSVYLGIQMHLSHHVYGNLIFVFRFRIQKYNNLF